MELNELQLATITGKRKVFFPNDVAVNKDPARINHSNTLFGVEIELEQFVDPDYKLGRVLEAGWEEHPEGSLVDGREFVMFPPKNGALALNAIDKFYDSGFRFVASERTSVHIHVDMTDEITVGQLRSILALVYTLEGPIYRLADENRKWASYCCPLTDMNPERWLGIMASRTKGELLKAFSGNYHEEKYYGCNTVSLRKHGTLEFRYFPCTTSKEQLLQWINLCLELRAAGASFADPLKLYEAINSETKLHAFLKKHLPKSYELLTPYLDCVDSHERILSVSAVCSDRNVHKIPHVGAGHSPAITRFLEARNKDKLVKEEVKANDKKLVDLYEILLAQQKQAMYGEQLLHVQQLRGQGRFQHAPIGGIALDDPEF